jgi:hypothetical protein
VISGLADNGEAVLLNALIETNVKAKEQEVADYVAENNPDEPYNVEIGYEVMRNDGRLLSIYLKIIDYCGGAHNAHEFYCFNADTRGNGQILDFCDLFTAGPGFQYTLDNIVREQIRNADEEWQSDASFDSVYDDQSFYLTDTDLVLVFPEASISSCVYGIIKISIPFSDLEEKEILTNDIKF